MNEATTGSALETLTIEILGTHLRVRVPADTKNDVMQAADLLRQRIDDVREPSDPPDRAVTRAALELAFESIMAQRNATATLESLLHKLDAGIST